jgi:hypothetical protein
MGHMQDCEGAPATVEGGLLYPQPHNPGRARSSRRGEPQDSLALLQSRHHSIVSSSSRGNLARQGLRSGAGRGRPSTSTALAAALTAPDLKACACWSHASCCAQGGQECIQQLTGCAGCHMHGTSSYDQVGSGGHTGIAVLHSSQTVSLQKEKQARRGHIYM